MSSVLSTRAPAADDRDAAWEAPLRALRARVHDDVAAALADAELAAVDDALARRGAVARADALLPRLPDDASARDALAALKRELADAGELPAPTALERWLLLRAMRPRIDALPRLAVGPAVEQLFLQEFALCARPDARRAPLYELGRPPFLATAEVAALRRFPAGQLHWNVSGMERRLLLRMRRRDAVRVLAFVARRLGRFAPLFFSHVNGLRKNRFVWMETESNRSYYRMADAMSRQPAVRGLATVSWFHGLDVPETAPNLAWTNRVIVDNGGMVVDVGPAPADAGFLENSAERRAAFEAGTYRPRLGLVLWPRDAMLDWAARNPQLADPVPSA